MLQMFSLVFLIFVSILTDSQYQTVNASISNYFTEGRGNINNNEHAATDHSGNKSTVHERIPWSVQNGVTHFGKVSLSFLCFRVLGTFLIVIILYWFYVHLDTV